MGSGSEKPFFSQTVLSSTMGNSSEKPSFSRTVLSSTMGNSSEKNQRMEVYSLCRLAEELQQRIEYFLPPKEFYCRILLVGSIGNGKSSLINTIHSAYKYANQKRNKEKGFPKSVEDGGLFSASDAKIAAGMQKMRVLKQNGLLEEELNWQDISFIADNLYMGGHLNYLQLKQIQDKSQPRRKAVDSLIHAIMGNPSAVSAFIRILESESRFSYIAEKITSTHIAAAELERVLTKDHLFQSLKTNQILNNKRKYLSFACEYPAAQKRMKMQESDSEAVKEKKMVNSLWIAIVGQKLWSQVGKNLGLEFKEAFKGPFEVEE